MKKIVLLIIISSLFIFSCCAKSTKPTDADIVEAIETIRDSLENSTWAYCARVSSVYIQNFR